MSTEDSSLSSSLTDLMTSLMVVFILLLVSEAGKQKAEALKLEETEQKLEDARNNEERFLRTDMNRLNEVKARLQEFATQLDSLGLRIEESPSDPFTLLIIMPERSLNFEFNSAELSDQAQVALARFTGPFIELLAHDERVKGQIESLVIEGHTDHRVSPESPFRNHELSQARSLQVLTYMLSQVRQLATNANPSFLDEFDHMSSASGRADNDCPADSVSEEQRRHCRKVTFKLRIRSESSRMIGEKIRSEVGALVERGT
jgi:outer membrane protein OmpA-like peptidoglycan-associated protein